MNNLFSSMSRRGRHRPSNSSDDTDRLSFTGSIPNTPPTLPAQPPVPQPPLPPGDGRDTLSGGEYARRCRTLMTLLKDLRALGYVIFPADDKRIYVFSFFFYLSLDIRADTVFDLPKIVVIGNQSGKTLTLFRFNSYRQ